MRLRRTLLTLALAAAVFGAAASAQTPADRVDPFIGTTNFGTANPGAVTPHGMMSVVPFNVMGSEENVYDKDARWWSTPYEYHNKFFTGFAHGALSGVGCPELGALLTMATTGPLTVDYREYGTSYRDEKASPGYYSVFLDKYGVLAEATATARSSAERYTFPEGTGHILLNLGEGLTNESGAMVRRVSATEIEGTKLLGTFCYNAQKVFPVYFVLRVSKTPSAGGYWKKQRKMTGVEAEWTPDNGRYKLYTEYGRELSGDDVGYWFSFDGLAAGEQVEVRMGISYVSTENARKNLDAEQAADAPFDAIREQARKGWNEALGRIRVEGGAEQQQRVFYTALYHALLHPNLVSDVNGEYPDLTDGQRAGSFTRDIRVKTRTLPRDAAGRVVHHMYNSDAFWLTQWNLNVLWGLGWPEMPDEMSASLIRYADNGGLIPRGPCAGGYTYIMSGCPATPLIVSAYNKGLMRKCDPMHAFRTMQRNHMPGGMQGIGEFYLEHGYQPKNAGMTIESNFQDWALAQMAVRLGLEDKAAYFGNRSHGWRKLYRPDQQLLFPKDEQGQWLHDDPLRGTGWIEANAWQATWGVSHELPTLATLMGGYDKFCEKLNYAFEQAAPQDFVFGYGQGYVSYANQPGCSNAHVFSWGGKPWLTQYWVRRVNEQAYGGTTPDRGYGGHDEDQGQMGGVSALMSIGLFSTRGTAAARPVYEITSPVFDEVSIRLDKRYYPADRSDRFVIRTYGNSDKNCYIQRARLNGRVLNNFWFPHEEFARGGLLELWLGPKPNTRWGTGKLPE